MPLKFSIGSSMRFRVPTTGNFTEDDLGAWNPVDVHVEKGEQNNRDTPWISGKLSLNFRGLSWKSFIRLSSYDTLRMYGNLMVRVLKGMLKKNKNKWVEHEKPEYKKMIINSQCLNIIIIRLVFKRCPHIVTAAIHDPQRLSPTWIRPMTHWIVLRLMKIAGLELVYDTTSFARGSLLQVLTRPRRYMVGTSSRSECEAGRMHAMMNSSWP